MLPQRTISSGVWKLAFRNHTNIPVRIKAFAGEKAAQHYRVLLADKPLWWEVETWLWVWSCFFPSAQSLPIPENLLSGYLVLYDLSNSLQVEQVRSVLSMEAAIRLFAECSKCDKDNCRVQVSGSSRKGWGFCSSSSMCAAVCRSPCGCKDAKENIYLALNHTGTAQLKHLQLKFLVLQHRLVIVGLCLGMAPVPWWYLTNTEELFGELLTGIYRKKQDATFLNFAFTRKNINRSAHRVPQSLKFIGLRLTNLRNA